MVGQSQTPGVTFPSPLKVWGFLSLSWAAGSGVATLSGTASLCSHVTAPQVLLQFSCGQRIRHFHQYFGHLMRRVDLLEKTLMLGGIGSVLSSLPCLVRFGLWAEHTDVPL